MRITGITANYNAMNTMAKAVSFKNDEGFGERNTYTKEQLKKDNNWHLYFGALGGIALGAGCTSMFYLQQESLRSRQSEQDKIEYAQKTQHQLDTFKQMSQSDEIRKDTFLIEDVTNDKFPDVILFKKDGSKVIFDVKKATTKEEIVTSETTLREVE